MLSSKCCNRQEVFLLILWEVIDIDYRYEEAIKHGGDHAVVVAELKQKKIIK